MGDAMEPETSLFTMTFGLEAFWNVAVSREMVWERATAAMKTPIGTSSYTIPRDITSRHADKLDGRHGDTGSGWRVSFACGRALRHPAPASRSLLATMPVVWRKGN